MTEEANLPKRRLTKAEVAERRASIFAIVEAMQPMTVRETFYQAMVRGIVEKFEESYDKVDSDLCKMRRSGEIPYEWIVDNTRRAIKPLSFESVSAALEFAAETYLKDMWRDEGCRVHIWIEKDALTATVRPVTEEYDVALWPARGYSSITFLHEAAEEIRGLDVPVYVYHFGDFDPSGENAAECIERDLRDMSGAEVHFERVALTEEQVRRWRLPTRPTKLSDTRAKRFDSDVSVELEAVPPNVLRDLVREVIERHMPRKRLLALKREERRERDQITRMVRGL
jgi:hypothetical protein